MEDLDAVIDLTVRQRASLASQYTSIFCPRFLLQLFIT